MYQNARCRVDKAYAVTTSAVVQRNSGNTFVAPPRRNRVLLLLCDLSVAVAGRSYFAYLKRSSIVVVVVGIDIARRTTRDGGTSAGRGLGLILVRVAAAQLSKLLLELDDRGLE